MKGHKWSCVNVISLPRVGKRTQGRLTGLTYAFGALNAKKVIDLCQETEDSEKAYLRRMNTPSMRSDKLREKSYSTRQALLVHSLFI